jgi:hypothetical protein
VIDKDLISNLVGPRGMETLIDRKGRGLQFDKEQAIRYLNVVGLGRIDDGGKMDGFTFEAGQKQLQGHSGRVGRRHGQESCGFRSDDREELGLQ